MEEKKALDIVMLDLREVPNSIVDFFVICSGNSDTQIEAISESIEDEVEKHTTQRPWSKEGMGNKEWIIIDYVDVVAHVFQKSTRGFYGLEELWGDGKVISIDKA